MNVCRRDRAKLKLSPNAHVEVSLYHAQMASVPQESLEYLWSIPFKVGHDTKAAVTAPCNCIQSNCGEESCGSCSYERMKTDNLLAKLAIPVGEEPGSRSQFR